VWCAAGWGGREENCCRAESKPLRPPPFPESESDRDPRFFLARSPRVNADWPRALRVACLPSCPTEMTREHGPRSKRDRLRERQGLSCTPTGEYHARSRALAPAHEAPLFERGFIIPDLTAPDPGRARVSSRNWARQNLGHSSPRPAAGRLTGLPRWPL
jgi:hypothetical protein